MRILIVEDSDSLRHALTVGLTRLGYAVDAVGDGESASAYIGANVYDVVVLDLLLPRRDGLSVLKEMRRDGNRTHVLILSARDQTADRVTGLELGADDYMVKPFAFEELNARIQALSRRVAEEKNPSMSVGGLTIDTTARVIRHGEQTLELSPKEYAVIEVLGRHRGSVLSRAQLIEKTTNFEREITENAIDVLISALRRKLKSAGIASPIQTKRGFGYYIDR